MNTNSLINQVSDPATQRALHALFEQLTGDLESNKAAFDEHTHYVSGTGAYSSHPASDAAGNTTGTRETFQNNLK